MYVFESHTHKRDCLVMFLGQYTESSKQRFVDDVQRAYRDHLTPELVLFVYPGYLEGEVVVLLDDENIIVDLTRQNSSSVICLSFNEYAMFSQGKVISGIGQERVDLDLEVLGPDIVKSGFQGLMEKRAKDVLVKSPSGTTFVKPSGNSLEEFIYTSQLARCNFEHQFIAMSVLMHAPNLDRIDTIYIDTSSISSIVESVIYYISRFRGSGCKHIAYRSFSSYSGLEENIKPDNVEGAWVIISASASLSMGKDLVSDWNIDPRQVVTILSYKKLLKKNVDVNIGNDVIYCLNEYSNRDKKSFSPTKVQVQGESFFAEVSTPTKASLLKKHKPAYVDESIFPFYNTKVFSVNRGGYTLFIDYIELRKLYLDGNKLSKTKDLYKWIKKIVEWKIPKNLKAIISSKSKDSVALVSDFKQVFFDCGFDLSSIGGIDLDDQASMKGVGEDSVLVLSPAVSTGHVFVDVNRALRLANHDGMRIFATPFVVAPSEEQFKSVNISLTQGTRGFKYSYLKFQKMFLTSKNLSSWSKELEVITEIINECEDDVAAEFWITRKNMIEKDGEGLGNSIGLHCDTSGDFELVPDFVFWPDTYESQEVNLAAVYATIGAIFQNLRENKIDGVQLSENIYQHSVLDPENFVRFNDSILQSCMWRCALPGELDYRRSDAISSDMQRILTKILSSSGSERGATSLDLLMGLATRWIKISPEEMKKVISSAESNLTKPGDKLLVKYLKNEFVR